MHNWLTVWGANLDSWGRIFYAMLYTAYLPLARSLVWKFRCCTRRRICCRFDTEKWAACFEDPTAGTLDNLAEEIRNTNA